MKKFVIALLVLFIGSCTFATEDLQKFELENGQTVIIKEVRSNPIVTLDTWIKTGSINENDANNGVSHFLEHLFFKGSKNHAPGEFDKLLETKGAITNAATSKDFTHYYITIPSKYFTEALSLHADMLLNPLIPRKELEMERKVVLEEISKDENSPTSAVYENLVNLMYTTHPYKRKVIGTRKNIGTIHRDEILDYYNKWYSPSNMVTVITGDVDTNTVLNLVKQNFAKEIQKSPKSDYRKEKPLTEQKRNTQYMNAQTGYMLIGFRGVDINDKDCYALDVLATILGEGRSSVFYKNIKDRLQLANTISASNSGFRDDGIFYVHILQVVDEWVIDRHPELSRQEFYLVLRLRVVKVHRERYGPDILLHHRHKLLAELVVQHAGLQVYGEALYEAAGDVPEQGYLLYLEYIRRIPLRLPVLRTDEIFFLDDTLDVDRGVELEVGHEGLVVLPEQCEFVAAAEIFQDRLGPRGAALARKLLYIRDIPGDIHLGGHLLPVTFRHQVRKAGKFTVRERFYLEGILVERVGGKVHPHQLFLPFQQLHGIVFILGSLVIRHFRTFRLGLLHSHEQGAGRCELVPAVDVGIFEQGVDERLSRDRRPGILLPRVPEAVEGS